MIKVQVCWVRRIMGIKRADGRRVDELEMEVGVKVLRSGEEEVEMGQSGERM